MSKKKKENDWAQYRPPGTPETDIFKLQPWPELAFCHVLDHEVDARPVGRVIPTRGQPDRVRLVILEFPSDSPVV